MLRTSRQRRGATLLEFALTFPIYVMVLMGIVDSGWLYFQKSSLDSATRIACRGGTVQDPGVADANLAAVFAYVQNQVPLELQKMSADDSGVTVNVTTSGVAPVRTLVCTVQQPYTPLAGFVLPSMTVTTTSAMRMEYQR